MSLAFGDLFQWLTHYGWHIYTAALTLAFPQRSARIVIVKAAEVWYNSCKVVVAWIAAGRLLHVDGADASPAGGERED